MACLKLPIFVIVFGAILDIILSETVAKKAPFSLTKEQEEQLRQATATREPNKTYYIDSPTAKLEYVKEELQRRGWREPKYPRYDFWGFKWTFSASRLEVTHPKQIVNHFANFDEIGHKGNLLKHLREHYMEDQLSTFVPRSYLLSANSTDEYQKFVEDFNRKTLKDQDLDSNVNPTEISKNFTFPDQSTIEGNRNIWIVKPSGGARGVGISVSNDLKQITEIVHGAEPYVVQKYVETPLLLSNKKFDIRQFALVTSLDPLVVFIHNDCYLRFTTQKFSLDDLDLFKHLTNHQVQKNSPTFDDVEIPGSQWSLAQFKEYLTQQGKPDVWNSQLFPKIKDIVKKSLKVWPKDAHRNNSFELLGFDILLDSEMNPWLIEINTNPGLHLLTDVVKVHHHSVATGLFDIMWDRKTEWMTTSPSESLYNNQYLNWTLLYHESLESNKSQI
eukprot:TRINITY_DN5835_c0_g1_i2.p1 TRINITY_DN5835_c0_g1~~TRINITY_DN5835_c0_g1_i2.p1  ORF type:complete len:445 (+),score=60.73 TRINITY_DN5835_c0_g1_i2:1336-2670(+)